MLKPYKLLPPEAFERPARQATRPRMSEEERDYYRGLFADIQDQGMPGAEIPLEEGENPKRVKTQAKSVAKELGVAIRFVRTEKARISSSSEYRRMRRLQKIGSVDSCSIPDKHNLPRFPRNHPAIVLRHQPDDEQPAKPCENSHAGIPFSHRTANPPTQRQYPLDAKR